MESPSKKGKGKLNEWRNNIKKEILKERQNIPKLSDGNLKFSLKDDSVEAIQS